MKAVEYLIYDERGLREVKCMHGCGTILSARTDTRERLKDGSIVIREKVIQQSHARTYRVELKDGSFQNYLICAECLSKIDEKDFKTLEKTARWGWKRDLMQRHNISEKDAQAQVDKYADNKIIVKHVKAS